VRATLRRRWDAVPLRARLVAILLVALVLALAATGWVVQGVMRGYLVEQVDAQLRTAVRGPAVEDGDRPRPGSRQVGTPFTIQYTFDGPPRFSWVSIPGANRLEVATVLPLVSFEEATRLGQEPRTVTGTDGRSYRAITRAGTIDTDRGRVNGSVTLAQPLSGVEDALARLRLLTVEFGTLVILACALLGWLAIRRAFAPLVEVERTAAAIAAGDLSRRIPEHPPTTEVGRLTSSLNGMLTRIEAAFRAREASEARTRRFAADASHELRTPLASIRGFAELYRQGAVPPSDVPRTMGRIEDEATRMGHLVEDLLLLARLDEQRPARTDPVDLAVLAGDALVDARALAPDREVRLVGLQDGGGPVPSPVTGDEDRLRQVVANLVANAVRHTPARTPVEIAVGVTTSPDGDTCVLEVRDHGPGVPPEQAPRVFERFYRTDASRQRALGGGAGLGLSIVAAVVAAHGGTADVRPTPGGGATFAVRLPRAAG
jgi:two-component system OmpR family sensor kinase